MGSVPPSNDERAPEAPPCRLSPDEQRLIWDEVWEWLLSPLDDDDAPEPDVQGTFDAVQDTGPGADREVES